MIKKILILIILLTNTLISFEIKKINEVKISQDKKLLQAPFSFCVTENKTFIIVDMKAADIKIYDNNGKLIKILGKKGPGPGEFGSPRISDYRKPYLTVMDFRKKKIFIYQKMEKNAFELIKSIYSLELGSDIRIKNNEILISGSKNKNGHYYSLYLRDILKGKIKYLLSEERKFGFNSFEKYKKYLRNFKIYAIGIFGYCDYLLNNVYYVWEGNLKIFKINSKSGEITTFGKKTKNYIQPIATKAMVNGYKRREIKPLIKGMQQMSYIVDLFANKDFVGLLYGNYYKKLSAWKIFLQLYTPEGKFLKELIIPEILVSSTFKPISTFYFKKNENLLYYMYHKLDKELNDIYTIATYKIIK